MRALQAGLVAAFTAVAGTTLMATTSTGCTASSQVRQVFMALDGAGDRPRDTFFTDTTTIYCDIVFSGYGTDETVDVQFNQITGEDPIFNGSGNTGPVARQWGGAETAPGEGIQTLGFTLSQPQSVDGGSTLPFPVGNWECVVTVNGESAGKADFTVDYPTPDCPATGGAYDGLQCVDHKVGSQCPSDSNFQNATACTCQGTPDPTQRVWVCQ